MLIPAPASMSASQWDWTLALADGLLSSKEEYSMLLEVDLFKHDDDLFKSFPATSPKIESPSFPLQDDFGTSLYPPSPPETKPSRAELANDLLQQLDNQCKQENIFSNWLEEKVDLPIFENISQVPERVEVPQYVPAPAPVPVSVPAPVAAGPYPQPTDELLREFESVYGAVAEYTHLTPPQSPPGPATQLLLSYAQQAQGVPVAPLTPTVPLQPVQEQWPAQSPPTILSEFDCSSQALEELVRSRAAHLASPEPSIGSGTPSPRSSPPSSPRSSSTDEDWTVPSRSKPYSRSTDDRRSRKKEQNKNAATRYRQKKKAEIEVLLSEEHSLRQRHSELGDKCADLQREIRYLKGLMRDLFKAKGLIK